MIDWRKRIIIFSIVLVSFLPFVFAHQFIGHAGDISMGIYGYRSTALSRSVSSSSRGLTIAERELSRLRSKANAIAHVSGAAIDVASVPKNLNNAQAAFRNAGISYNPKIETYHVGGGRHRAYNHQGYNHDYLDDIITGLDSNTARYRNETWRYGKELMEDAIHTAYGTSQKMTKALAMQVYTTHMLGDIEEGVRGSIAQMKTVGTAYGAIGDMSTELKHLATNKWWMSREGRNLHKYSKTLEHLSKSIKHQDNAFIRKQQKLFRKGKITLDQFDDAILAQNRALATKSKTKLDKVSRRFAARNVPEIKQTQKLERMANNKWLNRLNSSKFAEVLRKPNVQKSLKIGGKTLVFAMVAMQYKNSVVDFARGKLSGRQFMADVAVITGVNVTAIAIGKGIGFIVAQVTPIPGDEIILSIVGETIGYFLANKIFNPIAEHLKLRDLLLSIGENNRIIYKWTDDYLAKVGI